MLFPSSLHEGLMAIHAKDSLRCASIAKILNLLFAVPAPKALRTEGLVTRQDGQIFDLVATRIAAVGAIAANERAIAQEQKVCVRVEESAAGAASKAVDVPPISSFT